MSTFTPTVIRPAAAADALLPADILADRLATAERHLARETRILRRDRGPEFPLHEDEEYRILARRAAHYRAAAEIASAA